MKANVNLEKRKKKKKRKIYEQIHQASVALQVIGQQVSFFLSIIISMT